MRVRVLCARVLLDIAIGENLSKLPKALALAGLLFGDHVRVMPLFQLKALVHFRQDADAPFLGSGKHVWAGNLGRETAQLEYLHTRGLLEFDAMPRVLINAGDS